MLVTIIRILFALGISFGFFALSKRNIGYSFIITFIILFLSQKISGFIGLIIFSSISILYILWILFLNNENTVKWKKICNLITIIVSSIYLCIQSISFLLKITLQKNNFEIVLKLNTILLGVFFLTNIN